MGTHNKPFPWSHTIYGIFPHMKLVFMANVDKYTSQMDGMGFFWIPPITLRQTNIAMEYPYFQ